MTWELFFVRTAVHREKGIWAKADWPDVEAIRPFRNLWLAATRSDTGLAGDGISGLRWLEIPAVVCGDGTQGSL
jgi:hypothetical protein